MLRAFAFRPARGPWPRACAPTTLSTARRTRLLSSTPAAVRLPLRYVIWNDVKTASPAIKGFLGLAATAYFGLIGWAWWNFGPSAVEANVLRAFEEGRGFQDSIRARREAAAEVKRPDLEKKLEECIYGDEGPRVVYVVGETASGKSTTVRRVLRAKGGKQPKAKGGEAARGPEEEEKEKEKKDGEAINGAVYLSVPPDPADFSRMLMAELGIPDTVVDLQAGITRRILRQTHVVKDPPRSIEPSATWNTDIAWVIKSAAATFRKKHGRPVVLVIDEAQRMAKKGEKHHEFHSDLGFFAEHVGNDVRIVFVVSGSGALDALLPRGIKWWQHREVVEVGDISDADAVTFLTSKGVAPAEAEEVVRDLTGGSLALLLNYLTQSLSPRQRRAKEPEVKAARQVMFEDVEEKLRWKVKLPHDHALFRKIVEAGGAANCSNVDHLIPTEETRKRLLRDDSILAVHFRRHDSPYFTFQSRYVETFFMETFGKKEHTQNPRGREKV